MENTVPSRNIILRQDGGAQNEDSIILLYINRVHGDWIMNSLIESGNIIQSPVPSLASSSSSASAAVPRKWKSITLEPYCRRQKGKRGWWEEEDTINVQWTKVEMTLLECQCCSYGYRSPVKRISPTHIQSTATPFNKVSTVVIITSWTDNSALSLDPWP